MIILNNLFFWITLGTSDHIHLNLLNVWLLLLPHYMQKTNFITQLILEIKLTHYSGHILAVSCLRKSHTWDCSFSKYFQILYIFAQIFKYLLFFALFLSELHTCRYVLHHKVHKSSCDILFLICIYILQKYYQLPILGT